MSRIEELLIGDGGNKPGLRQLIERESAKQDMRHEQNQARLSALEEARRQNWQRSWGIIVLVISATLALAGGVVLAVVKLGMGLK